MALYSLTSIELNIYLNGKSPGCNSTFSDVFFAANKARLIRRQIIFKGASAFPRLYCLKFLFR